MSKLKDKIKNHFSNEYGSSPKEITDEEIKLLIAYNCRCGECGTSIFELDDYPVIDIEKEDVLCEHCYYDKYYEQCPLCEDSYHIDSKPDKFPKSPFYYIGNQSQSGIYYAKSYPIFSAALAGCGPTYIWWDNVEFVCSIEDFLKENKFDNLNTEYHEFLNDSSTEYADFIGPCCYEIALLIKNKIHEE